MYPKIVLAFILIIVMTGCKDRQISPETQLLGVWKVRQISVQTPAGVYPNPDALPGLFIFTGENYSMVWMPGSKAVPDNQQIWHPSDAERILQFNSIVVNCGHYSVRDSILITIPVVAKTPEFVGGRATYAWKVSGDTLTIKTLETISRNGILDEEITRYPATIILLRIE